MLFKRKDKAMAPQTETVELPDITEHVTLTPDPVMYDGGWVFPEGWTDEEINDWLITHPEGRPEVETINVDPDLPGGENGNAAEDLDEYEQKFDQQLDDEETERQAAIDAEIAMMKADGTYAAAIALPMGLQDTVTADNYDPRQFILVHTDVFNDMVGATHAEAELGLENKELRKRVNALTRGMRKINKHWSATKRELKEAVRQNTRWAKNAADAMEDLENLWEADRKRATIFATRLARRLRKARAGRDKRERQLQQANLVIRDQGHVLDAQNHYIDHLENLLNGARR